MPFTLAHPAIVVPLARRFPASMMLSGLVVGSMSPDFEYFVALRPVRTISHDLAGIPLLDVPSGLAVLVLFEYVMKRPMALLLPKEVRGRVLPSCKPLPLVPAGRTLAILLSLAVGAFSHIAWDSLTHEHGWVVERVPAFAASLGQGPRVYKVLQHGSTVVGLSLLAYWSLGWLRRQAPAAEPVEAGMTDGLRVAILSSLLVLSIGFATLTCSREFGGAISHGAYAFVVRFLLAFLSSLFLGSLAYSLALQVTAAARVA
jgi:hypothetical protein